MSHDDDTPATPSRAGRPLRIPPVALDAQRAGEDRAARAGGAHAAVGQMWARKADGEVFRIIGYNGRWGLIHEDHTVIMVGRDELVDEWTFTGCDHEAACCAIHGTHTMPHMGCVLR